MSCPFAVRKGRTLHCTHAEKDESADFCAHQYFCRLTNKWKNTKDAAKCPVRLRGGKNEREG